MVEKPFEVIQFNDAILQRRLSSNSTSARGVYCAKQFIRGDTRHNDIVDADVAVIKLKVLFTTLSKGCLRG